MTLSFHLMTNTIMILAISTVLVSVTFIPLAEASVGWNGFLREIGFGGPQVYEVSKTFLVPPGESGIEFTSLRCFDGDWMNVPFKEPAADAVDTSENPPILGGNPRVQESKYIRAGEETKRIVGIEGLFIPSSGQLFDVETTFSILCFSPTTFSSSVGGDWQGTDTVALFIGYSVLNAYWIAPLAIGVGAGIYLTKNKLKR